MAARFHSWSLARLAVCIGAVDSGPRQPSMSVMTASKGRMGECTVGAPERAVPGGAGPGARACGAAGRGGADTADPDQRGRAGFARAGCVADREAGAHDGAAVRGDLRDGAAAAAVVFEDGPWGGGGS